jgi:arabinogalactan oligomer/maltooligosaccharide transport system permease protein
MARTERPVSHRRRILIGLALAALLGVGLGASLLAGSLAGERRARVERKAVVTLSALAAVVDRASGGSVAEAAPTEVPSGSDNGFGIGDELAALDQPQTAEPEGVAGEAVRRAVARFAAEHHEVTAIRVFKLDGRQLEASTDPADKGDKAAPRTLVLDEKPLFDLGQKLRAAVEGNREGAEGAARAPEIAIERLGERLSLAAPVERGGAVLGMVQMDTRTRREPGAFSWLPFLAAWLAPVIVLFLLSLALGERRWVLVAVAAVLLVAALGAYGRYALGALSAERRQSSQEVAAQIGEESKKTEALLAGLGIPAGQPLSPTLWDVDEHRQSRGLIISDISDTSDLTVDEGRLGEMAGADAGRLTRSVATLAMISLALLAFVGLGWAARTGTALVEHRVAYAYVTPALLGMLMLVFFPFFYGVVLSFTNNSIYTTDKPVSEIWTGFQNYADILTDFQVTKRTSEGLDWNYENFYYTLAFTLVWTVSNVVIGVSLGLALALILNLKGFAMKPVYRVLLILPWAVPNYITALIFRGMFHRQFGVVNKILQLFGGPAVPWFDQPFTSFMAVLTTNAWLSFPFMMVMSLGALQSIPSDLYEAARVDGATRWQQFRSITLPSLQPALVPAVILSVIWTFNMFNIIYLVSGGQPGGSTEILITRAYKLAFEQYRYGYAAAYSMIIFLILFAYGTWQNRVTRATEAIG